MKLCGHTMGMPDLSIFEAIEFCARLGLEGIEIRCAANGHLDPETVDDERLMLIKQWLVKHDVHLACLTPYYRDYSSREAMAESLDGVRKTCRIAQLLDCGLVRATGGVWPVADREREDVWERTACGLQKAADIAIQYHVKLALENHSGTLTQTARDTVQMVKDVDRPNFGILMDHYWVVAAGEEEPLQAVRLQAPHVLHCHCKNLVRVDGKPVANFLDDGEIEWQPVLQILQGSGYDGYLSDEYEKFWRPELPEPEVGMARNAEYLRSVLERMEPAQTPPSGPGADQCGIMTDEMTPDNRLKPEQVERQVQYWLELADYDLETGRAMLATERLLYVAFMCHQTVEKALKALYVQERHATPPRIHALVALAQRAGAYDEMSPAQRDCLETLDPMNIECRYPAEKSRLLAALTPAQCEGMLAQTEDVLSWIRRRLSRT